MKCPACHIDLHMTERQGIEIDDCPQCRGVWLDRGELDTLIERATADRAAADPFDPRASERRVPLEKHWDDAAEERHGSRGRRRKSFLGERFDVDGMKAVYAGPKGRPSRAALAAPPWLPAIDPHRHCTEV